MAGFLALHFLMCVLYVSAASIDLAPLIDVGGTITLNPVNSYYLTTEKWISSDITILGNGATLSFYGGPLNSGAHHIVVIQNCHIMATTSWAALGFQSDTDAEVTGGSIASPGNSAIYVSGSKLALFGTEIKNAAYGINCDGSCTINLTNPNIHDCDMAYLQREGEATWHNGSVNQTGGAAINFINSVSVDMTGTEITMSQKDSIGIQFLADSTGDLHGVSIKGVSHGVFVEKKPVTIDSESTFSCPFPYLTDGTGGAGAGVYVSKGGALTIRDSSFTGFQNAIMAGNGTIPATVDIENCTFNNTEVSALNANHAVNVRFFNNECHNTLQDTIYMFNNSTGVIERNRIFNAQNSGFALVGCKGGIWIKDNYMEDTVHQSISIVNGSENVFIIGNTFVNGVIANIYVDATSTAKITGNICHKTPDYNIRFQGAKGCSFAGNLLSQSANGLEAKDSANPVLYLNRIADNTGNGILNYNGASSTIYSSHFHNNGIGNTAYYSVYNNNGSMIAVSGCRFSPVGSMALMNISGSDVNASQNYWESATGPNVNGGGPGSGSIISYALSGSSVTYTPFQTTPPLSSDSSYQFSLQSAVTATWNASFGTVSQTFVNPLESVDHQICGALQCYDTSYITSYESLPPKMLNGHLFVIWNSYYLNYYSQAITISFQYDALYSGILRLYKRMDDGNYYEILSSQNFLNHTIQYTPADPFDTHGIFVLVEASPISAFGLY